MSREYVKTEFNSRRISVIVHRFTSDKLAVESFTRLACYFIIYYLFYYFATHNELQAE